MIQLVSQSYVSMNVAGELRSHFEKYWLFSRNESILSQWSLFPSESNWLSVFGSSQKTPKQRSNFNVTASFVAMKWSCLMTVQQCFRCMRPSLQRDFQNNINLCVTGGIVRVYTHAKRQWQKPASRNAQTSYIADTETENWLADAKNHIYIVTVKSKKLSSPPQNLKEFTTSFSARLKCLWRTKFKKQQFHVQCHVVQCVVEPFLTWNASTLKSKKSPKSLQLYLLYSKYLLYSIFI